MTGVCVGATGESETSASVKPSSSRRRKTETCQLKFVADTDSSEPEGIIAGLKRQKLDLFHPSLTVVDKCSIEAKQSFDTVNKSGLARMKSLNLNPSVKIGEPAVEIKREQAAGELVKFGLTSVCGRRLDMEDTVSIHPSFSKPGSQMTSDLHFFGVFDGHGCSHVASKCKARMHEIVKEEIERGEESWKDEMERSFLRMDREVQERNAAAAAGAGSSCKCELQTPRCDAVGSTAVVSVLTPHKIIVSNCGDSRAVLSRNGVAVPLSSDHKPDRPDELNRIQSAGGRVIYWDGPRVLGVLAMSRAIGDSYLKPYVIPDPEVTITDRTSEDECLILASDGLWDVVSNETACGVARMCLNSRRPLPVPKASSGPSALASAGGESSDKACMDASILLTKLAMARGSTDNVSVVVVDLRRILNY